MLFNSFTFVLFFAVVLLISRLRFPWGAKKAFLLGMSYLFYAAWNPPFVILLWISTVADWFLARWMAQTDSRLRKKLCLTASLLVNLGMLGYFKYASFLLHGFATMASAIGFTYHPAMPSIILPVGISFYTFQTLSYTLDVYHGRGKPWHSFLDYALYVTFFPQLVAGPIVRSAEFLPQCIQPKKASIEQLGWGVCLMAVGLFGKVVIGDALMSPCVEKVYDATDPCGFLDAWGGTLAFATQIFCDFAGYSTCAIGVAMCLGFVLPDNFAYPYGAIGFSDFWRRWHITLSTWLRDYLYIPLGGNRHGTATAVRNLMATMLLGGLWHGASWTFVVWGGLHGCYLAIEHLLRGSLGSMDIWSKWPSRVFLMCLTFVAVCFAWVFFRAPDFETAVSIAKAMAGLGELGTFERLGSTPYIASAVMFITHCTMRQHSLEEIAAHLPWPLLAVVLAILICITTLVMLAGRDHAFIYFQF